MQLNQILHIHESQGLDAGQFVRSLDYQQKKYIDRGPEVLRKPESISLSVPMLIPVALW